MSSVTHTIITPYGSRETKATSTLEMNSHRVESLASRSTFTHRDPRLAAELAFHEDTTVWVLKYFRDQEVIGQALFHARSTAELMLSSLGYARLEDETMGKENLGPLSVISHERMNESA